MLLDEEKSNSQRLQDQVSYTNTVESLIQDTLKYIETPHAMHRLTFTLFVYIMLPEIRT